jgi:hypothetical protein
MENKKLSLAELKAKANNVLTVEVLNSIQGGTDTVCHDASCITPGPVLSVPTPAKGF